MPIKTRSYIESLKCEEFTTEAISKAINEKLSSKDGKELLELLAFMKVHGCGVEEFITHCTYWYDEELKQETILYAAKCINGEESPFEN